MIQIQKKDKSPLSEKKSYCSLALNSTLAMNNNNDEINNSLDNKTNLDILNTNFGDISIINNIRNQDNNIHSIQIEADDLILKMMLEEVNKIPCLNGGQDAEKSTISSVKVEQQNETPKIYKKSNSRYLECHNNSKDAIETTTLPTPKLSNGGSQLHQHQNQNQINNNIQLMNVNANMNMIQNHNQKIQFKRKVLSENLDISNINPIILETIEDDTLFKRDVHFLTEKTSKVEILQAPALKSKQTFFTNFSSE